MIDLYYSPTPNGLKVRLCLEELGLDYELVPVELSRGDQFKSNFLAISPNAKIPTIVDYAPTDGDGPVAVFESGAILLYLAERSGSLLPNTPRARLEAIQWLFWQVAGLGPMAGQAGYFRVYAAEPVDAAIERYTREVARLYGVLDQRLIGREFIAGDYYSIADIAVYPWIVPHEPHGQDLAQFPHLERWFQAIATRPATRTVYAGVEDVYAKSPRLTEEARRTLFAQGVPAPPTT